MPINRIPKVKSVSGKVGDVVLTSADVGLGNVNNTSDTNKPIPTAVQNALNAKQDILTAGSGISIVGNTIESTIIGGGSNVIPLIITKPTISGTAQRGQVLTYTQGYWVGFPTPSLTINWQRNGVDIPGATSNTYTLQVADVGAAIQVRERATNTVGYVDDFSAASATVAALPLPGYSTAPSISGTGYIGQTLTLVDGIYTNNSVTSSIQWTRNNLPIIGATNQTYTIIEADIGQQIRVTVTLTNLTGNSTFTTSPISITGPKYNGVSLLPLSADANIRIDKQAPGLTFIDPIYGLPITRISDFSNDAIGSDHINFGSCRQSPMNSDATKCLLKSSDGRWIVYDLTTSTPLNYVTIDPGAEPIWSATDPNTVYHTNEYGGLVWYARNVITDDNSVFVDFTGRLASFPDAARVWLRGGCPSASGRYWTFSVETSSLVHLGIITWDSQTNTIVGTLTNNVHGNGSPEWVSTSPSGAYAVVGWATQGTRAYSLTFSSHTQLVSSTPYGDLCYGSANQDLFCYMDEATHSIKVADCTTGNTFTLMSLTWGSGAGQEISRVTISGKAYSRPGWVFLSGYDEQFLDPTYTGIMAAYRAEWRKIFVARLVPSGNRYNVAYLQTTNDYGGIKGLPNACPSIDGRTALFVSNFGGQMDVDVYKVAIPDDLTPALPSAPSFGASPVVASASGIYETGQTLTCSIASINGEPFPTVSYQWLLNGTTNVGTNSETFVPTTPGSYSCRVTLTNNIGTATATSTSITMNAPLVALTTRVSSVYNLGVNQYTSAATPSFDVAAGDLIIVSVSYNDWPAGAVFSSISDTAGNTYTALPVVVCPDRENRIRVFYCLSSVATTGNVVTVSTPFAEIASTQIRATVYNPGPAHHFVYDGEAHASRGYNYGDITTAPFDTTGEGVIYVAFADNGSGTTPWPQSAPTGFAYIDNYGRPLVAMEKITLGAQTGVVGTMTVGAQYDRGCVQAVAFKTVLN